MDKAKRLKQLETLENEPSLVIFEQIADLGDKLRGIQGVLKSINVKEIKTYESELETLVRGLQSLTDSVNSKDTIVNIPLDQLSAQLVKVEQAIKAIKEVKIPEFPSEFSLNEVQINELLYAIQTIPEFPIDELKKMVLNLEKAVKEIKLEVPENEFDYDFLSGKFEKLIKAIKNISIVVSGGGGGIGERANTNLDRIANANATLTLRLAEAGVYTYIGEAEIGSSEASAVWRVKRLDETSGMAILFAGTGIFDQVWNDYLTLIYN